MRCPVSAGDEDEDVYNERDSEVDFGGVLLPAGGMGMLDRFYNDSQVGLNRGGWPLGGQTDFSHIGLLQNVEHVHHVLV